MAIEVNGKFYRTLSDEFKVNGAKVYRALANGVQVYPDGGALAGIKITSPPNKLSYMNGETIEYAGIVVKLVDGRGNTYTDERYPDGIVPFEELVFPVSVADGDSASWNTEGYMPISNGFQVYGNMYNTFLDMWRIATLHDAERPVYVGIKQEPSSPTYDDIYYVSLEPFGVTLYGPQNESPTSGTFVEEMGLLHVSGTYRIRVQTLKEKNGNLPIVDGWLDGIPEQDIETPIPVRWNNGTETFEDTFKITVTC